MESTLAVAYRDLAGDVGTFLGFGRGADNGDTAWDTEQQRAIDRCVKGGLRQVYFCGFDWSFLKPTAVVTLEEGSNMAQLPDDFGGFEGRITIASPTDQGVGTLDLCSVGDVYAQETRFSSATGRPEMVCLEPIKGTGATQGQRFALHAWPTADQDYGLQFTYYLLPDYLSGALPYAYGGAAHAETLLASCKAVAELDLDDMQGPQAASFAQKLAASQDLDRRNKPQKVGYNRDCSDLMHSQRGWRGGLWDLDRTVTFNGVMYGD